MSSSELVTILFTDLVGSTDLASELGDGAADQLRRDHFSSLREAIAATRGVEVKTIGDSLMVSYGGAADALAGAVAMQRAVDRHNRRMADRRLDMRIGISAGDATFEDDDWFGTPVVEASRLCSEARGGQIMVSELVRALAGSRSEFELVPLGTRELKGLPDALSVCEVSWTRSESDDAIALPAFLEAAPPFPFAGRVDELDVLVDAWKEAHAGARKVVLVSGEPGIGKTRLVTELARRAHDQGAIVLWGRCDEELGAPYEPFAEALRHYVTAAEPDRLRAELGPLGGELSRILPELAGRVPGLAEPVRTEAETERHRLFEAVADLISEASATNPVVLVLDDLHWADKPSLLMLRHLLRAVTPMRLLVLATYRDTDLDRSHPLSDVLADLRRQTGVERLDLRGFDESEVATFMAGVAGHELEADGLSLARAVHDETEGNPFFVGEVLLNLAESGAIVQRDGRWTSDLALEDLGIPEGIREVVGRRLSRLSDEANRALALGAVIGPQFDLATIEAAGGPAGDELFDALDEAAQAAIVREVPGTIGHYAFAHALVRSTLYDELTTNRRVRMHWSVGEAIEARHAQELERHLDELAYHYGEGALAGDPAKAVEFGRRAGERASEDLAFEDAADRFEHALGAIELVNDADPELRCDLQIGFADALRAAGDDRGRAAALSAAELARGLDDAERRGRAALILTSSVATSQTGTIDDELVALLESALDALDPDDSGLRARLLSALAVELVWGPEGERRRSLANEALAMARRTRDPDALSQVLVRAWALIDGSSPFLDQLAALNAEAERAAIQSGDPVALVAAHRGTGFVAACVGDRDEMQARFEIASRMSSELRRPYHLWASRNFDAALAAFAGDLADADRLVGEAIEIGSSGGVPASNVSGSAGALLYGIRMAQGNIGELEDVLEGLVESQPGAPVWHVALAGVLVEIDKIDAARPHFMFLAENDCAQVPLDVEFPVTLCGLARMSYRVRPPAEVARTIHERLVPFAGVFNWSGVSVTDPNDLGLAMNAALLGWNDEADQHFSDTIDLCERAGARPYLARAHFDWARVLADRGDAIDARNHLDAALELGRDLDMTGPVGVVPRSEALLATLA